MGDVYLEEFSLANAEDVTEVLPTTYSYPAGGDLAKGIGVFLEVEGQTGEVVELVECNFDPRCAGLPQL